MSRETLEDLNANTLIGFTDKRGQAWHYREEMQGDEPNHYTGAIPVEDVRRRLFGWEPIEAMSAAIVMTDEGVQTIVDETRKQIVHPNTGAVLGVFKSGYQVVVCDNTLSVALGSFVNSVKVRHSSKSLGRLGDVREALQLVLSAGDAFNAQVRELIAQPVSEARFEKFLTAWTDTKSDSKRAQTLAESKRDALRGLWRTDERVAPWRGTAWGVVAGVNTYTQHEAPIRGADRVTRNAEFMLHGRYNALDAGTLELLATV